MFTGEDTSELLWKHYTKAGAEGGGSSLFKNSYGVEVFEEKFEGLKSGLEMVLLKTA